jgi:ribose/xylose/arabinose/galactoside ABC-type transport system permease subunit
LLLWRNGSFAYAAFAVSLIGFSIGAELDLLSFFCARNFDLRHFSATYGAISFFFYTGIAAGGIAYGALHDLTGTYAWPLLMSAVLFLVAGMLFLMLPSRSVYGRQAATIGSAAAAYPSSEKHT